MGKKKLPTPKPPELRGNARKVMLALRLAPTWPFAEFFDTLIRLNS